MPSPMMIVIVTLGDPARLTGGSLYQARMATLAPRYDARVAFVSFPERRFPPATLVAPAILAGARRLGADALVLDSIVAAALGPWLALRRPDVPVIGLLHQPPGGIDHGPWRAALQAPRDRRAYRHTDGLIVVSEALADTVVGQGFPRERVRVVPPGCDPVPTAHPDAELSNGRGVAILCVANWVERKGIHSLLDSFARLPPAAATLHLVGDDRQDRRYAARIRARCAQADVRGRVVIHGPQPPARVAGLYAAADIFGLPSVREPFGMVYAEAMAAGLPVVGWRAGNLPYLVTDGAEGLLAPPGDIVALAAALARLARDEPLRRHLGAAARTRARAFPTWDEAAARFFAVIREVVERGR